MAVLATAAGAAVIGLDPLPPPEQAELARLVASAEPRETRLLAAAPQAESAPAVVHTGALVTPPPNPEIAPPPVPEPAVVAVPVPPRQPEAATAAEPTPAPAVIASVAPEPEVAREPEGAPDPVPQVQADLSTAFPATVKPAELNGLVSKGEQFLKAGDLASARLFFERAANAGDLRGAYGMAQSYDPAVVRKLPVYGLAVDGAEADRWYAKRVRSIRSKRSLSPERPAGRRADRRDCARNSTSTP